MKAASKTEFGPVAVAIGNYLDLLKSDDEAGQARIERLVATLDRLVIAYHDSTDVEPGEEEIRYPPVGSIESVARTLVNFPELRTYADVDPEDGREQEIIARDPVHDLIEIGDDLTLVMWLAEHVNERDALWEFRFGYRVHWGRHLHDVRRYLQYTLC